MRILRALPLLLLALSPLEARAKSCDDPVTGALTSTFLSSYTSGTNALVIHDKPVVQNELYISWPCDFYTVFWQSVGTNDADISSDGGDEVDYTFGWAHSFRKDWYVDLSASIYDNSPTLVNLGREDSGQFSVIGGRRFVLGEDHVLTLFAQVALPFNLDTGFDGEVDGKLGVQHRWRFSEDVGIRQKLRLNYDDGVNGAKSGLLLGYEVSPTFHPLESLEIRIPYLRVIGPLTDFDDGRKTEFVFGAVFSLYF